MAAANRAAELEDMATDVHSVDVTMALDGAGGMDVASVHVWNDHCSDLEWIAALRQHLAGDVETVDLCAEVEPTHPG